MNRKSGQFLEKSGCYPVKQTSYALKIGHFRKKVREIGYKNHIIFKASLSLSLFAFASLFTEKFAKQIVTNLKFYTVLYNLYNTI